jgi:hypothetical protein
VVNELLVIAQSLQLLLSGGMVQTWPAKSDLRRRKLGKVSDALRLTVTNGL